MQYKSVCCWPEHLLAAGLDTSQAAIFLNGLAHLVEPVEVHFLWRAQRSIRAGVERMSNPDGVNINQFASIAVAEKLAMLQAQAYFAERSARGAKPVDARQQ